MSNMAACVTVHYLAGALEPRHLQGKSQTTYLSPLA